MFKLELVNLNEKFGNTGKVTSPRLKDKKIRLKEDFDQKPYNEGLFSEVVFGTNKDFSCACGRYKGVESTGIVCEKCGVKVQSALARRFTFGHIDLGKGFLVNPEAFKCLCRDFVFDKDLKHKAEEVIHGWLAIKVIEDLDTGKNIICYVAINQSSLTGPVAFKDYILPLILEDIAKNEVNNNRQKLLQKVKDTLFTNVIPVIPPDLRPVMSGSGNTTFMDELNKIYMVILMYVKFITDSPVIPNDKLAALQEQFDALPDILLKKLSGKTGTLRKYLLGKRINYSGRGVVVPDYTLDLQHIDLSIYLVKEIFKPAIIPELAKRKHILELEALKEYDSDKYSDEIFDICKKYEGYPIILNRQPSLHRPSLLVFFIRHVVKDYIIAVPPAATTPFNMDFDGDQAAIYAPISGMAYSESINMIPIKNLFLPSNGELAFSFDEDLVLGLYKLSLTDPGRKLLYKLIKKLDPKVKKILKPYVRQTLTGKNVTGFFSELIDSVSNETVLDVINIFSNISFKSSVISTSLVDFINAKPNDRDNPVSLMVDAEARGKWGQLNQLQKCKGWITDVEGNIIPTMVKSSLIGGLSPHEFFVSSYGSIKGLIDTAKNTAQSGYLTRRLVYASSNTELSRDVDDCGTTRYLERTLTKDNYKLYLYRYFKLKENDMDEIVLTKFNYREYLNKPLLFRSPFFCKCEGNQICHKCYGLLFRKFNSKQIGIIAAQSLGERAAQLTLRTKHTSGATDLNLPSWINIDKGYLITKKPIKLVLNNNVATISDQLEKEEFEIPYNTFDFICPIRTEYSDENYNCGDEDLDDDDKEVTYYVDSTGKIAEITLKSHDVVSAVAEFSKYLRNLDQETENGRTIPQVLDHVMNSFGFQGIHAIHYEVIMSNFCRNENNTDLLYRYKQDEPYIWLKEKELINSSFLQSAVFESANAKLSQAVNKDDDAINFKDSMLSKLLSFDIEKYIIEDGLKETWGPVVDVDAVDEDEVDDED